MVKFTPQIVGEFAIVPDTECEKAKESGFAKYKVEYIVPHTSMWKTVGTYDSMAIAHRIIRTMAQARKNK